MNDKFLNGTYFREYAADKSITVGLGLFLHSSGLSSAGQPSHSLSLAPQVHLLLAVGWSQGHPQMSDEQAHTESAPPQNSDISADFPQMLNK